jgi:PEP-CTERM motif
MKHSTNRGIVAWTLATALVMSASLAQAAVVFSNLPTNNSFATSHHATGGPILADDFAPATSGAVTSIEWWGTRATDNRWEIAFNTNNAGHPNIDNPFSGAWVKFGENGLLTATGVADVVGHPEIFHYQVDLSGPLLGASTSYWLTVANFADGWQWADALNGPTIGTEAYNAHSSVGGICADGGPHCGPWTDVHTDFAFRINAVPEPGSFALAILGLGLTSLRFVKRRAGHTSNAPDAASS